MLLLEHVGEREKGRRGDFRIPKKEVSLSLFLPFSYVLLGAAVAA